ncbi:MAG: ATP-dependent protease, partial [bacterium]
TRHMLFIVSGAFDKLGELVKRRVGTSRIGFTQPEQDKRSEVEYLKLASTKDFIEFGFEPEFIGRLPVRVVCEHLGAADLEEILMKSEGSILMQYQADFAGYGIKLTATREAISTIAGLAEQEHTGARGLMTVLEKTLRDYKFELPSSSLKQLSISRQMVIAPARELSRMIAKGLKSRSSQS